MPFGHLIRVRRPVYFFLFTAFVALASNSVATAQEADLDGLAKRLSKEIAHAGIDSVVVADFVSREGQVSGAGHFLACELSQGLVTHKKGFVVADQSQLRAVLSDASISLKDLTVTDSLERIGTSLRVNAVITGMLQATSSQYSVTVTLRSAKDGSIVSSSEEFVKRPTIADAMALLSSKVSPEDLAVAGQDGVGIPTCVYCPPPRYTEEARKKKVQRNVVLVAIVTAEGHASKTAVTRAPEASLANQAAEAVTKWSFKPATDKSGRPMDVLVPIEVTFRLY